MSYSKSYFTDTLNVYFFQYQKLVSPPWKTGKRGDILNNPLNYGNLNL